MDYEHPSASLTNLTLRGDDLYALCRQRAAAFYRQHSPVVRRALPAKVAWVATRLRANLASGRAQRLLGLPPECWPLKPALLAYIDRIVRYSDFDFDRLARMQAGDDQAWRSLYEALRAFAFYKLVKTGIDYAFAAERAQELANHTCLLIFQHPYPGDVDFMAWACRILLNHLRAGPRSTDVTSRFPDLILSLDRPLPGGPNQLPHESMPDTKANHSLERADDRAEIVQLLRSTLGARQREIIVATYFEGRADAEIARALDSTAANVQVSRHRALRRLKRAAGL